MTFKKLPVCNSVKTINSHYVTLQLDFATLCSIFFSPLVRLWKILSWLRWLYRVLIWRHKKWNLWNNRICQDIRILKEQHPGDIWDISPVMFWWLHTNPSKFVSSPWLHFVVRARKPASFYDEFFFCRSGGSKSSNLLINGRFTILRSAEALLRFSQPRELLSSKAAFTIDLFTDTAAILNLLDLGSIMGCPEGTRSVLARAFRAKRELHLKFFGKKAIIITSRHGTTSFFPIIIFF